MFDQPFWADLVENLGVGPAPLSMVHVAELTVDRLSAAVRFALQPSTVARARALSRELACEVNTHGAGADRAVSIIEQHAQEFRRFQLWWREHWPEQRRTATSCTCGYMTQREAGDEPYRAGAKRRHMPSQHTGDDGKVAPRSSSVELIQSTRIANVPYDVFPLKIDRSAMQHQHGHQQTKQPRHVDDAVPLVGSVERGHHTQAQRPTKRSRLDTDSIVTAGAGAGAGGISASEEDRPDGLADAPDESMDYDHVHVSSKQQQRLRALNAAHLLTFSPEESQLIAREIWLEQVG